MKPRQRQKTNRYEPRGTRLVIALAALLAAYASGCGESAPGKTGQGEPSAYVAEGDRYYHAKECAEVTSRHRAYALSSVAAEGYEPCPACQGKTGTPVAAKPRATRSPDARPPYALTPEQAATYKPLGMKMVLARSPNLTPQESNEFSAIGIKVDGITTERGRRQVIGKMVELFGEKRAREMGAVFYDEQGQPTHAWPRPLENQPGSATPFPEE